MAWWAAFRSARSHLPLAALVGIKGFQLVVVKLVVHSGCGRLAAFVGARTVCRRAIQAAGRERTALCNHRGLGSGCGGKCVGSQTCFGVPCSLKDQTLLVTVQKEAPDGFGVQRSGGPPSAALLSKGVCSQADLTPRTAIEIGVSGGESARNPTATDVGKSVGAVHHVNFHGHVSAGNVAVLKVVVPVWKVVDNDSANRIDSPSVATWRSLSEQHAQTVVVRDEPRDAHATEGHRAVEDAAGGVSECGMNATRVNLEEPTLKSFVKQR